MLTNGTASDRLVNMLVYLWMCRLECTLSTSHQLQSDAVTWSRVFTAQRANLLPWLFLYRSTLLLQRVVWHFRGAISNALPKKHTDPFLAPPQMFLLSVACALIQPTPPRCWVLNCHSWKWVLLDNLYVCIIFASGNFSKKAKNLFSLLLLEL